MKKRCKYTYKKNKMQAYLNTNKRYMHTQISKDRAIQVDWQVGRWRYTYIEQIRRQFNRKFTKRLEQAFLQENLTK